MTENVSRRSWRSTWGIWQASALGMTSRVRSHGLVLLWTILVSAVLVLLVTRAAHAGYTPLHPRNGHMRSLQMTGEAVPKTTQEDQARARKLYVPERPWDNKPPRWCQQLMRNPRERPRTSSIYDCRRGRFGAVCEDGAPRFFSQYNQDIWTWKNHWRYLSRPGTYVDIAANEPVRISNTYFYDICLNWRGLCVEAHPLYRDLLINLRSCGVLPTCVSDRSEKVRFALDGGSSGVQSTNKNSHVRNGGEHINITCVPTAHALDVAEIHAVDMLSLDVEGHEFEVLKGIDWARTRINLIAIESLSDKTRAFLHALGYRQAPVPSSKVEKSRDGNLFSDFVFLHPDVVWGKPV